jgi:hypothetical protein
MASLKTTAVTGSFTIGTSTNTSTAGNMWYNTSIGKLQYTYTSGPSVATCTL